jgi:uncharacterized protein
MSFNVLARATYGALVAPGVTSVTFVWHGGEPTLKPLAFYRKALWLQEQFRRSGQRIVNSIQTNGVSLKSNWIDFFCRYAFAVGVSLDGPPDVHDARRIDVIGAPTAARVRKGLQQLAKAGVNFGVLVVVDDDVVRLGAQRLLAFLLEIGVKQVGLLNVVPEGATMDRGQAGPYLAFPSYVQFLREMFEIWWPKYKDVIHLRELASLTDKLQAKASGYCVFAGNCVGSFFTIEPAGDVSACDKFQGDPDYRYGNVLGIDLADIVRTQPLIHHHAETAAGITEVSRCPWFAVCQGGCPHDRYVLRSRGVAHDAWCCGLQPLLSDMASKLMRLPGAEAAAPLDDRG